ELRRQVTLDSTAPVARIDVPKDGGWLRAGVDIQGQASDTNLLSWKLETAPGVKDVARSFSTLATGDHSTTGTLSPWTPLPPDGTLLTPDVIASPTYDDPGMADGVYHYCVTALDRAGNESGPTCTDVTVDTTPPTVAFLRPPAGSRVSGTTDIYGIAFSASDF